ncbi:MAG: DnaA regulatory inactivator Hda [Betaproteobacteria bacterium]|nr:DnaA regulatory inactivator Hda [Betaproteobacteria bacterium]
MQQITLDIGTPLIPTLDNFFPGPNAEALAYLREWLQGHATGHARAAEACFIAGAPGSGKSHLVSALARAVNEAGASVGILRPDSRVAADFDPAWSAVILEDVHAFDAPVQHAAFNWFVHAQTYQRAVFATGNATPRALALREDLRTRLGGGQIFQLQALTEAQVRAVLQDSARLRGLVLGDDVLDFVLHRFSRDLGSLMPLLTALDHFALQTQRAITIPFIKTMLERL